MATVSGPRSYADFVRWRTQRNPCLTPFAELFAIENGTSLGATTIHSIDYDQESHNTATLKEMSLEEIVREIEMADPKKRPQPSYARDHEKNLRKVILVEDIDKRTIEALGSCIDVDPEFFAHYLLTDFGDIESVPAPPQLALSPSTFISKNSIHLHYQQVLDFRDFDEAGQKTFKFRTLSNVRRGVRCTPPLPGLQPAIMRGCCSALLKHFDNSWICLILIDSSSADLISWKKAASPDFMGVAPKKHAPFRGGFEDFFDAGSFSDFATSAQKPFPSKASILQNLLWYYERTPPGLDVHHPNLLSLVYYPLKIISSFWILYVLLLNRYYISYEYTVQKSRVEGMLETDLVDLQRWRRRARQSLRKLKLVIKFISLHAPSALDQNTTYRESSSEELTCICRSLLDDLQHLTSEIEDYNKGMEFLISISTAMVQLAVGRQSILEASNIRRLTYVALFFAPLGLVAAVFSMAEDFLPGKQKFWIYLVAAVSAMLVVVGLAFVTDSSARNQLLKLYEEYVQRIRVRNALLSETKSPGHDRFKDLNDQITD